MRDIEDILHFRGDLSPFLVHLTRDSTGVPARDVLRRIIEERRLQCGDTPISDARFGMNTVGMDPLERQRMFSAICFTETPLSEVHCLLDIQYRHIDFGSYGLVFLKERLAKRGVGPVLYINNEQADNDAVFQALCALAANHREAAERLLPLVSVFGQKVQLPGAPDRPAGRVDFRWEREWRFPFVRGDLVFIEEDVFVGLCPDGEIVDFEARFQNVDFIDPTRNMKWYATKLIRARQRLDIRFSVV
jgi:hypothetical protein